MGLVTVAVAFHPYILTAIAEPLIVDDAPKRATHVVILGTHCLPDLSFSEAARNYSESSQIVLVGCRPSRLAEYGAVPSFDELSMRELMLNGVPPEAVIKVDGDANDTWSSARSLGRWLAERPDTQVTLLCDQFASRYHRLILDSVLGQEASRVHVHALRPQLFDERDWWRSRRGVKHLSYAYMSLGFLWLQGEGTQNSEEPWNPDEYEQLLVQHEEQAR